jgi:quercetin dioxygenase-like cupin family protein
MRIASTTLALLLSGTAPVFAQSGHADLTAGPSDVKWGAALPTLPPGAQVSVLSGDPLKGGPYVLRIKMPNGYQIPAHHHPTDENVTVLSGSLHAGIGNKLDQKSAETFEPGGFILMPASVNHYLWATGDTIVQVHGSGPFEFIYVNPADNPSKK